MRKAILTALAASLVLAAAVPAVAAEKLDAPLFDAVLKTARQYAEDRTLAFYCLRKDDQLAPFLYAGVHIDIAYALQLLRAAGADDRQRAELVEAVLRNIRPVRRDAEDDPQRNVDCVAADVEKSVTQLKGVGAPLFMRPPFDKLKP